MKIINKDISFIIIGLIAVLFGEQVSAEKAWTNVNEVKVYVNGFGVKFAKQTKPTGRSSRNLR